MPLPVIHSLFEFNALFFRLFNRFLGGAGSHRRQLLGGTFWSLIFRVADTGFAFLTTLLLARLLDTEGYGSYYFLMAVLTLAVMPAGLGLNQIITREVATGRAKDNLASAKGIAYFSIAATTVASVLVILAGLAFSWLTDWRPGGSLWVLVFAAVILTSRVWVMCFCAFLRGLQQVSLSQIAPTVRVTLIVLLLAIIWAGDAINMDVTGAVAVHAVAALAAIATAFGLFLVSTRKLGETWRSVKADFQARNWLGASLSLMLLGGLSVLNTNADIVMLGTMADNQAVAVYHAATRGASLLGMVLLAAKLPLGPMIARIHAEGDRERQQRLLARSTLLIFLASLPLALVFIFQGDWFLGLIGEAFVAGRTALIILSLGFLFRVACGPVDLILIMSGHERTATKGIAISAVANLGLNALLIPQYGANGAALATGLSIVIWNALLVYEVWRKTGLNPTITAVLRR